MQGERTYLAVDWIAICNILPQMFNVKAEEFVYRLRFVNKLYEDSFGHTNFTRHILVEKAHKEDFLRLFMIR